MMLFRFKSKRVDVNSSNRDVSMALIRLDQVEIRAETLLETVMAVKLEFGTNNWVSSGVDGSKTGVVRVVTSGGDGTEIGWSQVIGVGTRTSG